jgi:3-phosphoshikimate 1-carboxyvinyltransferase
MNSIRLNHTDFRVKGELTVPGDKSISHRAVMFGSIAEGTTVISNFLRGDDCLATMNCFRKMGVKIEDSNGDIIVHGKGITGLKEPKDVLYTGNSGTTARLLLGLLSGLPFYSVLNGDVSLNNRPMSRVTDPLKLMGAQTWGRENNNKLPISIQGTQLSAIEYELPVASAQVKSALILAGLLAEGVTKITGKIQSRDHTEKLLQQYGAYLSMDDNQIIVKGGQKLHSANVFVPGDISSAAFFIALGLIVPGAELVIKNVGLNETRTGILDVVRAMGGNVEVETIRRNGEPFGNIYVKYSDLTATEISGAIIPRLIDEIPIIALIATQAEGTTIIRDAAELKVKETNRIEAVVTELSKLGASIEATDDGMIIHGKQKLKGGQVKTHGDHRIGMMLAIASFICSEDLILENADCIKISYPNFFQDLKSIVQ